MRAESKFLIQAIFFARVQQPTPQQHTDSVQRSEPQGPLTARTCGIAYTDHAMQAESSDSAAQRAGSPSLDPGVQLQDVRNFEKFVPMLFPLHKMYPSRSDLLRAYPAK